MVAMGDTFQAGELGLEVAPNSGNSTDLPTHMHARAHTHKHTHALSNTSHSPYTHQYIQLTHHVCNHTMYKLPSTDPNRHLTHTTCCLQGSVGTGSLATLQSWG